MSEPEPDRPPRRPRYRGKNPRNFAEKYKEHRPDLYAEDVARVIASGRTPAGSHRPIMVGEILRILAPKAGEVAVDCTIGYGGHSAEIFRSIQPGGVLIGIDADPIELPKTTSRLLAPGYPADSLVPVRSNFAGLARILAIEAPDGADMILADLGVSSMQIDDPARGFSIKHDGPLDMRMNPSKGPTAAELLSSLDVAGLANILAEYSDEPRAEEIARSILIAHRRTPISTTRSLATVISAASPRNSADASIRRVFQALRIAVNGEIGALSALLRALPSCLKPGGRAAILTFHSGEDRLVKTAFREGLRIGDYSTIADEVIRPSPEERRSNPRSSSAKLRFAIRSQVRPDHPGFSGPNESKSGGSTSIS